MADCTLPSLHCHRGRRWSEKAGKGGGFAMRTPACGEALPFATTIQFPLINYNKTGMLLRGNIPAYCYIHFVIVQRPPYRYPQDAKVGKIASLSAVRNDAEVLVGHQQGGLRTKSGRW